MKTKLLSLLALLLMTFTGAMAKPITIVWSSSGGGSFDERVQYSMGPYDVGLNSGWILYGGGIFTTNLGNFTEIKIEGGNFANYVTASGWNGRTWTGKASSVLMDSSLSDNYGTDNFTITFTIEPINVSRVMLSDTEANMILGGDALTLSAHVVPEDATYYTVIWTTSDASVATVVGEVTTVGNYSPLGVVTAVGAGTATITATATNGTDDTSDDKTATCTVTVEPPTYSIILAEGTDDAANWTISPAAAEAGETVTLTYAGTKTVKSIKVVKKEAAAAAARPLTEATAEDLGKIAGADGNIYDTKDAAEAAGTTAVAMIAYVGSDTDHATYKQGLAIALDDESSSDWDTAKSTCEGKSAVTNAAWLLPSEKQWKAMFKAFGDDASIYLGLNTTITTAGGTALKEGYYWSSSEIDEMGVISMELDNGDAGVYVEEYKDTYNRVRACLAFGEAAAPATAYTLAESTVGMIVGSDGNAYAVADKDNLPEGVTAVAMVAYKSATADSGLAIALADEITADEFTSDEINQFDWSTAKSICEGKSAVSNAAWMLPSEDQWKKMFKAFGDDEDSHTGLNTAITTAGGTALVEGWAYWSSSEVNETYAWEVFPNYYGHADWTEAPKSIAYRVRACLVFGEAAAPAATAYTLAESTVGMIVGSDGNAYAVADKDNLPEGVTAVAMVAYKSETAGSSLAIALAHETDSNWSKAKSNCEGKSAVANATWMLPSQDQWKAMFKAFGDNEDSYTGLQTAITTAGGEALGEDQYYWTSSEVNEIQALRMYLDLEGVAKWSNSAKTIARNVRACLAF